MKPKKIPVAKKKMNLIVHEHMTNELSKAKKPAKAQAYAKFPKKKK